MRLTNRIKVVFITFFILICASLLIVIFGENLHFAIKLGVLFGTMLFSTVFEKELQRFKYLNSSLSEIDKFSGDEFEKFLKWHFESIGYKAEQTKASHDKGADLVMYKDGKKILVQAKRYKGSVGTTAIQEILAAKAYYGADECLVVTNNEKFTKAAVDYALKTNVTLWGRNEIKKHFSLKEIKEYKQPVVKTTPIAKKTDKKVSESSQNKNSESIICDKCGKPMVKRKGKYGEFYGCTGYPNCKNTKKL